MLTYTWNRYPYNRWTITLRELSRCYVAQTDRKQLSCWQICATQIVGLDEIVTRINAIITEYCGNNQDIIFHISAWLGILLACIASYPATMVTPWKWLCHGQHLDQDYAMGNTLIRTILWLTPWSGLCHGQHLDQDYAMGNTLIRTMPWSTPWSGLCHG